MGSTGGGGAESIDSTRVTEVVADAGTWPCETTGTWRVDEDGSSVLLSAVIVVGSGEVMTAVVANCGKSISS
jgi:hypothetical protein